MFKGTCHQFSNQTLSFYWYALHTASVSKELGPAIRSTSATEWCNLRHPVEEEMLQTTGKEPLANRERGVQRHLCFFLASNSFGATYLWIVIYAWIQCRETKNAVAEGRASSAGEGYWRSRLTVDFFSSFFYHLPITDDDPNWHDCNTFSPD